MPSRICPDKRLFSLSPVFEKKKTIVCTIVSEGEVSQKKVWRGGKSKSKKNVTDSTGEEGEKEAAGTVSET